MGRLIAVDAAGVRLHAEDLDPGTGGGTVVLLHGWSLSGACFDRQLRVLAAAGLRAVAIDLRGHGASDRPLHGYGLQTLAADVAAVLDALDLHDVTLVGWSIGGLVATRVALDAPDRVGRLVNVAASGAAAARTEAYPFGVPAAAVLAPLLAAEHGAREASRRDAIAPLFAAPPDPDLLDHLVRLSLQTPSWAGAACLRTLLGSDQSAEVGRVGVPVTHIAGTADPSVSLRGVRWAAARMRSELVELDCGHYPMYELPDAFDAALLAAATTPARPQETTTA